jgi:hypothetical protein
MKLTDEQTLEQFRDQCRRQMDRPLTLRPQIRVLPDL